MYALLHKRSQHIVRTEFILLNILNSISNLSFLDASYSGTSPVCHVRQRQKDFSCACFPSIGRGDCDGCVIWHDQDQPHWWVADSCIIYNRSLRPRVATNNPAEGVWICADGDPLNGTHWIMFYWVALLFLESCLSSLALYQAWMYRHKVNGGGLIRAFSRDSVWYFIMWVLRNFLVLNRSLCGTMWIVFHQLRMALTDIDTGFSGYTSRILYCGQETGYVCTLLWRLCMSQMIVPHRVSR